MYPTISRSPPIRRKPAPGDIEAEFATANNAPKEAFRVSCPQNEFSAVEICLSKDLKYLACPATVKECKAGEVKVRPVP